ncbi:MAG: UbiA-like protein EboC [Flavobacteriaceae bacterium]
MGFELRAYAILTRPANLPTAAADILAGVAIAAFFTLEEVGVVAVDAFYEHSFLLVCASIFLYAGGVVLNDFFDFKIDQIERPERPIPSGLVSLRSAMVFGIVLLCIGMVLAFFVATLCGIIAFALALCIVLYDAFSKKHTVIGPLNMGVCRGLNLILGMSILGVINFWWFAIISIAYIFAITLISRGEVHGKNKNHIVLAGVLYAGVIFAVGGIVYLYTDMILVTSLFLLVFVILIFRPLVKAYQINSPENIKKAVIAGVLSLIVLDASIAVGFSHWWYGLGIVALLPISMVLSKFFSVT